MIISEELESSPESNHDTNMKNCNNIDSDSNLEVISSNKRNTPHFSHYKHSSSFGDNDFCLNDRFSFKHNVNDLKENDLKYISKSFIESNEPI